MKYEAEPELSDNNGRKGRAMPLLICKLTWVVPCLGTAGRALVVHRSTWYWLGTSSRSTSAQGLNTLETEAEEDKSHGRCVAFT